MSEHTRPGSPHGELGLLAEYDSGIVTRMHEESPSCHGWVLKALNRNCYWLWEPNPGHHDGWAGSWKSPDARKGNHTDGLRDTAQEALAIFPVAVRSLFEQAM